MLRIGWIDYANCTPIFSALTRHFDCSGYTFVTGVPAELNAMLADGRIDVSPSSSIEYARHEERYALMPHLSISSVGPVRSVLLFSRVPLQDLNHRLIGLTAESAASVALLKILLADHLCYTNRFERVTLPVAEALEHYEALLLIGDAALKAAQTMPCPYVYDLGELWYQMCNLPFVFALWIVRRDARERLGHEVLQLSRDLVAAKERARREYAEIAAASPSRQWLGLDGLVSYWNTISYDLDSDHLDGLRRYYRHAAGLGIIDHLPEIRFIDGS